MGAPRFELKKISPAAIEEALRKAERYRLLNEPAEAESICLDILEIEPDNQQALITLVLSITDQFGTRESNLVEKSRALLPRLRGEYERAYYAGIISERRGTSLLRRGAAGSGPIVYDWLRQAMQHYEKAQALRPPANESAVLRWNACARTIMRHPQVVPGEDGPQVAQKPLE